MEESGVTAPFLNQKQLKHILVGVEKLVKTKTEQDRYLMAGVSEDSVITFVNQEREKCGLEGHARALSAEEIKEHDSKMFQLLDNDIDRISVYVEKCATDLNMRVQHWLQEAELVGLALGDYGDNQFPYRDFLAYAVSKLTLRPEFMLKIHTLILIN